VKQGGQPCLTSHFRWSSFETTVRGTALVIGTQVFRTMAAEVVLTSTTIYSSLPTYCILSLRGMIEGVLQSRFCRPKGNSLTLKLVAFGLIFPPLTGFHLTPPPALTTNDKARLEALRQLTRNRVIEFAPGLAIFVAAVDSDEFPHVRMGSCQDGSQRQFCFLRGEH
jgi:hypothetical protein